MSRRRRTRGTDRFDESRKRWVRVEGFEFIHYEVPEGERDRGEGAREGWGVSHFLSIFSKYSTRNVSIDITSLTLDELEAIKKVIDTVFDEARDICAHRDRLAREALEDGDDSFTRLYREVPRVVDRSRQGGEHGSSPGS